MIIIFKHLYKINRKRKKKKNISNKQTEKREKKGSEDESQKGTNTFLQVRKRIQEFKKNYFAEFVAWLHNLL